MGTLLRIAIRSLLQHRRRSALLGAAVAFVTALLVLLSSMSNGMQVNMLRVATTLSTGHVNVAGFYKVTSGSAAPLVKGIPAVIAILDKHPELGVESYVVRGRGWGKLIGDTASQQGALVGVEVGKERVLKEVITVTHGRIEDLALPNGIMLFEAQAERLGAKVGDDLTVSAPTFAGANNTLDTRVVAIAKDMGLMSSFSFFLNDVGLHKLYQIPDDISGAVQLYLRDPETAPEVASMLRRVYADEGYRVMEPVEQPFYMKFQAVGAEEWTGQKLDITTWMDEMQFMRYTLQTFRILTFVFISVLLVMIIVGVMNTLWMSIRERTKEIGTLRAIGMQRPWVLGMFVIEAGVLAVVSTVAGSLIAALAAWAMNSAGIQVSKSFQMFLMSDTLQLLVDLSTALTAVVTIGLVTTLGSVYPAWRAAKQPPVTAISHVN